MTNVLIIGATSAIAKATARVFAKNGANLFLVARNDERMQITATDLTERGGKIAGCETLDVMDFKKHQKVIDGAFTALGSVDVVLIAHGTLPDQAACEADPEKTLEALKINGLATVSLLTILANSMEAQGAGSIVAITSVAGDRGRASNYIYGTAKRMVSTYLEGMGHRLHPFGINVVDVRPGFVASPMTKDFDQSGLLWSSPETVGRIIHGSIKKHGVLYAPWFWKYIMLIIRHLPRRIFYKLKM